MKHAHGFAVVNNLAMARLRSAAKRQEKSDHRN
jgi:hypothetical protein